MPVVDASVLAEYFGAAEHAGLARSRLAEHRGRLWAPCLVDAEVGHVLRRGVRRGRIEADAARQALEELALMPLRRARHEALVHRAWELRDNLSFYDALYVALAEVIEQPLITFDARIARADGVRAEVEVLPQAA
jgi:predicted nucleic acid-binding protein